MTSTVELLRPLPLLTALTPQELGKLAEVCETKSIVHEREPDSRLFMIVDGGMRISRQVPGAGEVAPLRCSGPWCEC